MQNTSAIGEVVIQTLIQALLPSVTAEVQQSLQPRDDLLTAQQVNKEYYHVGNDQIQRIVNQHGFPRTEIPGNKNPKYSRKAVEKFIADHQEYHI